MNMRAPSFWWQDHNPGASALDLLAPKLLAPLSFPYAKIAGRRMLRAGLRLPVPVLCVGNFVVGGAGKTPATIALAKRLIGSGEKIFFLSRGYRSAAERGPPIRVDPLRHGAAEVGDEALLLARAAPTIASADRVAAGGLAIEQGASLLILDDGLQNPALEKDMRLAVVDGATGVGNGLTLPAGPLRAPLSTQIDFVSAVVIVGAGAPGAEIAERARAVGKPVVSAKLIADEATAAKLKGQRVYAFAGLGRPEKFYATLADLGAEIVGTASFPDHHLYAQSEIARLRRAARQEDALLVTTEKDLVRLAGRGDRIDPSLPPPIALPVEMEFSDAGLLDGLLAGALRNAALSGH
jgi:tetraacyldisaccharide 4'-kinase